MKFGPEVSVNDIYEAMSEGERIHMANKLYKHEYVPIKLQKKYEEAIARTSTPQGTTAFTCFDEALENGDYEA